MKKPVLLLATLFTVSPAAIADAEFVYESYEGVTLGRVFLSPAERDWLDARRHEQPAASSTASGARGSAKVSDGTSAAAGYITGPDGRSRVWRRGDFVESGSDATRDMEFPGDIDVVRHAEQDAGDDDH